MNAKKIIAITAVSLVILAETGVLQVATEKLEVFRKRLQEKYAAKEQELAQKMTEQKSANHYWRYDIRRPCCSFGTAYQTSVCGC